MKRLRDQTINIKCFMSTVKIILYIQTDNTNRAKVSRYSFWIGRAEDKILYYY